MTGKMFKKFIVCVGILAFCSCSQSFHNWNNSDVDNYENKEDEKVCSVETSRWVNTPNEEAKIYNKRIPDLNSLIICRDKQCAPAQLSKSREYIFNSLAHIVDNNIDSTALLCEANPQAHVCTNPYLTIPARIGITPAYVYIDSAKIVDASIVKGKTALELILAYNLSYNGQSPNVCKPDTATMYVKSNNDIVLNGNGFACNMTSVGQTTIKVLFDIDFIDLDYGYIGGYYSIGLSGPATGGGNGYGIFRLQNDTHPLNPELLMTEDKKIEPVAIPTKIVRPEVDAKVLESIKENEVKEEPITPTVVDDKATTYGTVKKEQTEIVSENKEDNVPTIEDEEFEITADTVVSGDKVILKPKAQELRPYEVSPVDNEEKVEEIKINDYIQ